MKKIILLLLTYSLIIHSAPSFDQAMQYKDNEQFKAAIACFEEIVGQSPTDINAFFQLGYCYLAIGEKEKAINAFETVLACDPTSIPTKYNLAYTYKTFGDIDKAIELYQEVIELDPNYDQAHLAIGFAYITHGDFEKGWEQHIRYLRQSGKNGDELRALLATDDVAYKTILLTPEGGLGDTINFVRYAQSLKNMGADIVVACQKQLVPLFARCDYIDQIVLSEAHIPPYHARATLMSLPAIFEDSDETVPQTVPYIFADPALVEHWKKQLAHDTNFKVGICWQVDVHNDQSKLPIARRGYPLESFAQLADLENVSFYSLQKCDGLEQLATLPSDFNLHVFENLDEQSGAFMDTAALMKNLDLIITVDTAIAHLAGALGCTVWLLHPYATADWRWIHGRSDSYWYPTMRIFKQHEPFGYDGVIQEVKSELQKLVG